MDLEQLKELSSRQDAVTPEAASVDFCPLDLKPWLEHDVLLYGVYVVTIYRNYSPVPSRIMTMMPKRQSSRVGNRDRCFYPVRYPPAEQTGLGWGKVDLLWPLSRSRLVSYASCREMALRSPQRSSRNRSERNGDVGHSAMRGFLLNRVCDHVLLMRAGTKAGAPLLTRHPPILLTRLLEYSRENQHCCAMRHGICSAHLFASVHHVHQEKRAGVDFTLELPHTAILSPTMA